MRTEAEYALRTVLRQHVHSWTPDKRGRVGVCSCGDWRWGQTSASHLIEVLRDEHGMELRPVATVRGAA